MDVQPKGARWRRGLFALADILALGGGLMLLVIVAVTVVNAGAFILDRVAALWGDDVAGLPGYEDFVRLGIGAAAPMLLPFCQARRGHVTVDLFTARLPSRATLALDRVWLLVMAGAGFFLAYWMTLGMMDRRARGAISGVLGWPEWPFMLPGILALVLWALIALAQTREHADAGA